MIKKQIHKARYYSSRGSAVRVTEMVCLRTPKSFSKVISTSRIAVTVTEFELILTEKFTS
jgi:hypothetical protein